MTNKEKLLGAITDAERAIQKHYEIAVPLASDYINELIELLRRAEKDFSSSQYVVKSIATKYNRYYPPGTIGETKSGTFDDAVEAFKVADHNNNCLFSYDEKPWIYFVEKV